MSENSGKIWLLLFSMYRSIFREKNSKFLRKKNCEIAWYFLEKWAKKASWFQANHVSTKRQSEYFTHKYYFMPFKQKSYFDPLSIMSHCVIQTENNESSGNPDLLKQKYLNEMGMNHNFFIWYLEIYLSGY